jgi:hypothetical protein
METTNSQEIPLLAFDAGFPPAKLFLRFLFEDLEWQFQYLIGKRSQKRTYNFTLEQTLLHNLSERFEKPGRLFHFFASRDHQIKELFNIGLCCDHAEPYANKTILAFTCNEQNSILIPANTSTFGFA